VLLIMDSLTRVAHAAREIGLLLGEPGAARGYPPSALATITKLVERAGNSAASGGSITGLYTVLADGDNQDDPVVDTARSILDGHIVLLARFGPARAVSGYRHRRFAEPGDGDIVRPDHTTVWRANSARFRKLRSKPRPRSDGRLSRRGRPATRPGHRHARRPDPIPVPAGAQFG
jgi:flagellum-specific ATP synthase